jgi:RimJ/RimL family protein N-acetyltransferase
VIHFERSFDYETIRSVMTHPQIYPHISDDSSPPAGEYRPIESEVVWYVEAQEITPETYELLGYWIFHPQNAVCWEVHTCLLPAAWGDRGLAAARVLPEWIWEHTPCRRIITNVPMTNRLALQFAFKAGMKVYGVNESSYLKDGELHDQVCLGISRSVPQSREEEECQQQPQSSRP